MRVAIIGSGFAGLCLGMRLRQMGVDDFTLFEKSDAIGGTWRDNTYPGCACDLMSFAYCFSFEQKKDWSRKWSPQPEILDYIEHCADKYGLRSQIELSTEVIGARFDADQGLWRIETRGPDGVHREREAEVLVSGVGQLHRPVIPKLPGIERFAGASFHSAQWAHDVPLEDRRVVVIGNGASAIQFVPEIAKQAKHVCVVQRTPNWHIPRGDRAYTENEQWRFAKIPFYARLYRWWIWARQELLFRVMDQRPRAVRRAERLALGHLRSQVADPELRERLTPDYPIGGKRILIHDDYYPALCRENVSLVTEDVDRIESDAVVFTDGSRREADVLIFATGFDTTSFLAPMRIEGLGGRTLDDTWKEGAEAYLGMTVPGFPNFFMMYGPNTNLGHNSILFMLECQANYVLRCLDRIRKRDLLYLDVRPEAMDAYNWELQSRLRRTAWAATDHSWYKNDAGRITNNWHGTTTAYWRQTRRPDFDHYRAVRGARAPR